MPKSSDVLSNSLQSRVLINEGVDSLHLFNYLADVTLPVNTWRHWQMTFSYHGWHFAQLFLFKFAPNFLFCSKYPLAVTGIYGININDHDTRTGRPHKQLQNTVGLCSKCHPDLHQDDDDDHGNNINRLLTKNKSKTRISTITYTLQ